MVWLQNSSKETAAGRSAHDGEHKRRGPAAVFRSRYGSHCGYWSSLAPVGVLARAYVVFDVLYSGHSVRVATYRWHKARTIKRKEQLLYWSSWAFTYPPEHLLASLGHLRAVVSSAHLLSDHQPDSEFEAPLGRLQAAPEAEEEEERLEVDPRL